MFTPQSLTCPVIRPAHSEDARGIAEVLVNSNSAFIKEVFHNKYEGAIKLLANLYSKHYQGVFVLQEGDSIIGVMKIHLPGVKMGKTVSLFSLMKNIGIIKGLRAAMLLSNWDEYKLSNGEAYIEFMYVLYNWKGFGCEKIMLQRAKELAFEHNAIYLSIYQPLRSYREIGYLERNGYDSRRKIYSPVAKILRSTYVWRRYTYTLTDRPLTVREFVISKYNQMRVRWQNRRRESDAALRVSLIMIIIPIVGGSLAAIRGYPLAAIGWGILIILHISGALFLFREFYFGKFVISGAMISESINLLGRAILTTSWFDRGWLLPLALLNIWVLISLMRTPKIKELKKFEETNTLVSMNEIIQKGKLSI